MTAADRCGMPTGIPGGCPLPGNHDGACQPQPVRCRCSHAAAQHYWDRRGRPMCVGPCACPAYRPATPVGVSSGELLTPTGSPAHALNREDRRR